MARMVTTASTLLLSLLSGRHGSGRSGCRGGRAEGHHGRGRQQGGAVPGPVRGGRAQPPPPPQRRRGDQQRPRHRPPLLRSSGRGAGAGRLRRGVLPQGHRAGRPRRQAVRRRGGRQGVAQVQGARLLHAFPQVGAPPR
ncbi:hypothetical protein PVAP13_7KG005800 [Panicum virgatum]|uniref:Uncharacterized protein n=1 Tax=Panicum virgatum TaxID=38727 RepID=A0A8T0QDU2_PANVG|nr:hypothetical protein PVAP13_7KG005800 [Panicum virgatum]